MLKTDRSAAFETNSGIGHIAKTPESVNIQPRTPGLFITIAYIPDFSTSFPGIVLKKA